MGRPELAASEVYGDQRKRLAARETVDALVTEWVASLDRSEVLARCLAEEVPAGKVNSIADIFEDEHFAARGNLERRVAEGLGEVVVPGVVPRLSATPGRIDALGPTLGDATIAVLTELLQLDAAQIGALRDKRII
jgi:succinyl-CoA:(S)-malate CoA-transferase subunit A